MMLTQAEVDVQLQEIIEPVPNQALIDELSALALMGKVNWYEAKKAVVLGDPIEMRRLIRDGT